jgi:hypothetical protein
MSDVIIPIEQDNKTKSKPHNPKNKSELKAHNSTKPHNGRPITKTKVSPNGNYVVTYSEKDYSIVGWNVKDIDEGRLEPEITAVKTGNKRVRQICVSDDKKLVYIYHYTSLSNISFIGKQ